MKPTVCIIFIGFLSYSVFAQEPNIQWNSTFQAKKEANSIGLLGADSSTNTLYFLKAIEGGYQFFKYVDNKVTLEKKLDFSEFKKRWGNEFNLMNFTMLKDRFVFYMLFVDNKKSTANLFLLSVSFNGEYTSQIRQIAETNASYKSKLDLVKSPNSDYLLAWISWPKQKGVEKLKVLLKTFDHKLSEVTSKEVNIPGMEDSKKTPIENILIDNNEGITILGFKEKVTKGYYHDTPLIWYLEKNSEQPVQIQFTLNDIEVDKYKIEQNKIGETVFEGFYNLFNIHEKRFKGYFYGVINPKDQRLENLKFVPIPSETQNPPRSTDSYFPDWEVIQKQDGGQIWIYEYQWVKSNDPHLGELLILNINNDGSLQYSTSVNKDQSKYLGVFRKKDFLYYYSYLAAYNDSKSKLSILFNEGKGKNQSLYCVVIDYTGRMEKTLVKSSDESIIFSTGFRIRVPSGEMVLGIKDDELWSGILKDLD